MAVVNTEEIAKQRTDRLNKELDELLGLAEQFQGNVDKTRSLAIQCAVMSFLSGAGTLVSGGFLMVAQMKGAHGNQLTDSIIPGVFLATFCCCLFLAVFLSNRVLARQRRDTRALREVLAILRELEGEISRDRDWSPLQKAMFRIRLSRFEVGGGGERGHNKTGVELAL